MACSVCGGVKQKVTKMGPKVYYINAQKLKEADLYSQLMFALATDKEEFLRAFLKVGQDLTSMTEAEEEKTMEALASIHKDKLDLTQGFDVFKVLQSINTTKAEVAAAGRSGRLVLV